MNHTTHPTMRQFVTEMCTCVHISVTIWCIVWYLFNALCDLWDGSIGWKQISFGLVMVMQHVGKENLLKPFYQIFVASKLLRINWVHVTANICCSLHCKPQLLGYTLHIFVIATDLSYLRFFIGLALVMRATLSTSAVVPISWQILICHQNLIMIIR